MCSRTQDYYNSLWISWTFSFITLPTTTLSSSSKPNAETLHYVQSKYIYFFTYSRNIFLFCSFFKAGLHKTLISIQLGGRVKHGPKKKYPLNSGNEPTHGAAHVISLTPTRCSKITSPWRNTAFDAVKHAVDYKIFFY